MRAEQRPRIGIAFDQNAAVPRDLHTKKGRCRVEGNQVDDASGFALETHAERGQINWPIAGGENADIEIAVGAIKKRSGRAEQDGQSEFRD